MRSVCALAKSVERSCPGYLAEWDEGHGKGLTEEDLVTKVSHLIGFSESKARETSKAGEGPYVEGADSRLGEAQGKADPHVDG
eukprot:3311256-Prorocentrum_lima.AAC.1